MISFIVNIKFVLFIYVTLWNGNDKDRGNHLVLSIECHYGGGVNLK